MGFEDNWKANEQNLPLDWNSGFDLLENAGKNSLIQWPVGVFTFMGNEGDGAKLFLHAWGPRF